MQIIEKQITELKPYERNPRINDNAVKYVANSIKEFGWKVPIVIDKNNVIVAGHTRYKAALDLNIHTIPCIIADDLTDEQIKAYRLADNKIGELADWDFDLLNLEMEDLSDIDMSDFGFKTTIDSLFDFIQNDDFINNNQDKKSFGFTLEFESKKKPYFTLYVKKYGKEKLVEMIEKEVMNHAA